MELSKCEAIRTLPHDQTLHMETEWGTSLNSNHITVEIKHTWDNKVAKRWEGMTIVLIRLIRSLTLKIMVTNEINTSKAVIILRSVAWAEVAMAEATTVNRWWATILATAVAIAQTKWAIDHHTTTHQTANTPTTTTTNLRTHPQARTSHLQHPTHHLTTGLIRNRNANLMKPFCWWLS